MYVLQLQQSVCWDSEASVGIVDDDTKSYYEVGCHFKYIGGQIDASVNPSHVPLIKKRLGSNKPNESICIRCPRLYKVRVVDIKPCRFDWRVVLVVLQGRWKPI